MNWNAFLIIIFKLLENRKANKYSMNNRKQTIITRHKSSLTSNYI